MADFTSIETEYFSNMFRNIRDTVPFTFVFLHPIYIPFFHITEYRISAYFCDEKELFSDDQQKNTKRKRIG